MTAEQEVSRFLIDTAKVDLEDFKTIEHKEIKPEFSTLNFN